MDDVVFARVLHVLAVAVWIGGVSMVTTIVLPAVRRGQLGADRFGAFKAIEHRFAWQVRVALAIVGLTGLYMIARLGLWDRFRSPQFWWMHAMVFVWLLFALILFAGEPFVLDRNLKKWAMGAPDTVLKWLQRAHWILLVFGLLTIAGAVAGSHGWSAWMQP